MKRPDWLVAQKLVRRFSFSLEYRRHDPAPSIERFPAAEAKGSGRDNEFKRPVFLNIGIFTDCYVPVKNGVVTSISQLKAGLEARGHRVVIFTVNEGNYLETDTDVIRFRSIPIGLGTELSCGLVNQARVNRVIRDAKIELLHSHTEFNLCISAIIAARKFALPRVQTGHTMWEEYNHYILNGWLFNRPLVRFLLRSLFGGCVALVAPSAKSAKYFSRLLPRMPIEIIPNGVNSESFMKRTYSVPELADIRDGLGIPPRDKVILFVGRIGREKRVVTLLESIAPLLRQRRDIRLVFVGDGPELKELRERGQLLSVENQVICTGYVDWESISGIYRVSDLFVTASMSEVHSMTMIEAMMCSLPVIARKDDSFLGSVQDGVNGYLVESDEGLCEKATELLADEEKLKQFRQASWRIAGEFTGQRHADRMAEFYQRILNGIGTGLPAVGEA